MLMVFGSCLAVVMLNERLGIFFAGNLLVWLRITTPLGFISAPIDGGHAAGGRHHE